MFVGLRVVAALAAVLGGLTWLAVPWWGGPGLWWSGLVLLTLACLALGAALVSRGTALRLLVATAFLALVGCVWMLVRDSGDATAVDVVTGVCRARRRAGRAPVAASPAETGRRRARAPLGSGNGTSRRVVGYRWKPAHRREYV